MNKNYFSHDLNARSDPKLMKLAMRSGMEGLGIYWCIIEMLYEQDGRIPLINIESIAFALHTECERIKDVLQNYDLFRFEGDYFTSDSVLKRIEIINAKSETARKSANDRWRNKSALDANAMQSHSEGNAIKVNNSKVNNNKEEDNTWRNSFEIYLTECKNAYRDFMENDDLIKIQSRLHPGVNIKLSIEKGFTNFWGTEAGWKHKKKSRIKDIDWHLTIINSIDLNKVYLPRNVNAI